MRRLRMRLGNGRATSTSTSKRWTALPMTSGDGCAARWMIHARCGPEIGKSTVGQDSGRWLGWLVIDKDDVR